MKYEVGQKVKIRSLEWYRDNVNRYGIIECGKYEFVEPMNEYCGKVVTIKRIDDDNYRIDIDKGAFCWTDEMIEGLVEDANNHFTETVVDTVRESNDRYRIVIDPRFDIEVDEGEYYAIRRKKEYLKTYEECEKILGLEDSIIEGCLGYEYKLLNVFQKLLICRNAYWKLYGDDMGLGKPWEPDWSNEKEYKYVICRLYNDIVKDRTVIWPKIFAFPTPEMRDAFYENFKELIESCKELL